MAPRAWIVVDLGFGDAGKGTVTDALVRRTGARWVVRYNGGAQAGHNVMTDDGRHHTFSQFGSGSFVDGVGTYLAPSVIIHPSALLFEARHLASVGVPDAMARLRISDACRVTSPYHQAAGRLRELARGDAAHGTCGVGVGETVRDALAHPGDVLRARDLRAPDDELERRLERIRQRVLQDLGALRFSPADPEWDLLCDSAVSRRWMTLIEPVRDSVRQIDDGEVHKQLSGELSAASDIVLEGAQGVLLDEWFGFHPHTTWSTCTTRWAQEWLAQSQLPHEAFRLGVVRTYATRHGQGPFPSEAPHLRRHLPEPHNDSHAYQGQFRVGWPDPVLTRYAIRANGGVEALAVTHLDRLSHLADWQYVSNHPEADEALESLAVEDLEHQRELGVALMSVPPRLRPVPATDQASYVQWLSKALGVPVWLTSHGPTAADKTFDEAAITQPMRSPR